jgi:hypothetical protein
MSEIEILGQKYEYETSIDNKKMTITNIKTGAWAEWHDDENHIGDSDFHESWEDWIQENFDNLEWVNGHGVEEFAATLNERKVYERTEIMDVFREQMTALTKQTSTDIKDIEEQKTALTKQMSTSIKELEEKMKIEEKFLIRLYLNEKYYPIYWLVHESKNSTFNIYFGSYSLGQEHLKTSVHNSGTMHIKEHDVLKHILSNPVFSQKLDSFKGIHQIHAGVVKKSQIETYQLRNPKKIHKKNVIDIDISSFNELINLHIEIVEQNNNDTIELYKKTLPIKPKFEVIITNTTPWLYFVAF